MTRQQENKILDLTQSNYQSLLDRFRRKNFTEEKVGAIDKTVLETDKIVIETNEKDIDTDKIVLETDTGKVAIDTDIKIMDIDKKVIDTNKKDRDVDTTFNDKEDNSMEKLRIDDQTRIKIFHDFSTTVNKYPERLNETNGNEYFNETMSELDDIFSDFNETFVSTVKPSFDIPMKLKTSKPKINGKSHFVFNNIA